MWIAGWLWSQCKGNWASSQFDFGYTEQFCIPGVTSVFFSSVTVLLGTLWRSIKQIKAPYVFDWENAIALDTMLGNRTSSRREMNVSWVFWVAAGTWGIFSSYSGDVHSKL